MIWRRIGRCFDPARQQIAFSALASDSARGSVICLLAPVVSSNEYSTVNGWLSLTRHVFQLIRKRDSDTRGDCHN